MTLNKLNFPHYNFRFQEQGKKQYIFDEIRKKFIRLTPEEWVRQNTLHYLLETKGYPAGLTAVEMSLTINSIPKRADIVLFKPAGTPWLLIECKAPNIPINKKTFEQIIRYNIQLNVQYFMLTNGITHIFCELNYENNTYTFIKDLPDYR